MPWELMCAQKEEGLETPSNPSFYDPWTSVLNFDLNLFLNLGEFIF